MFYLSRNRERLTFHAVKKVFDSFTMDAKLAEIMNSITTQGKESLNVKGP